MKAFRYNPGLHIIWPAPVSATRLHKFVATNKSIFCHANLQIVLETFSHTKQETKYTKPNGAQTALTVLLGILLLLATAKFVMAGPFEDGIAAFNKGEHSEAIKLWRQAATRGDREAQAALSDAYFNGHGVPQDYAEAVKWARIAAEQGQPYSQSILGDAYFGGHGVPQDYAKAAKWYRMSAEHGSVGSHVYVRVGLAYDLGQGVPQDYAEAVKWYRMAAERGSVSGQVALGFAYHLGQGVIENDIFSHMWFNLAAAQGNADAAEARDAIAKNMSREQIATAQKMASEWKPKQ